MSKILIEPHFLGSIEYFSLILSSKSVRFEIHDTFSKKTFRNRTCLLGSNKIIQLTVPVNSCSNMMTKEVRIDYSQRWIKDHWGTCCSSYGKAPFFEYFKADFQKLWEKKHKFLIDLNVSMFELCLKFFQVTIEFDFSESYQKETQGTILDYRNVIHPKIPFSDRKIYHPKPYAQLFGNTFVPNLSILDVIMCEGFRGREFC